jgi:hypothetical protein
LACPDARLDYTGCLTVHGARLAGQRGLPLVLAAPGEQGPFVATKPTDRPGSLALDTPQVRWKTPGFGCGQVRLYLGQTPRLELDRLTGPAPFFVSGQRLSVVLNGVEVTGRLRAARDLPGWKELPADPLR